MSILQFVITLFILLIIYLIFKFYRLKHTMQKFANKFEEMGYKVKLFPAKLFAVTLYQKTEECEKKYGDPVHHLRYDYTDVDIIISSTLNQAHISLINPKLLKQYFQNTMHYDKDEFGIENIVRGIGRGLLFTRNQPWKRKKKIFSKIFYYQFFLDQIPRIVAITDNIFNRFQQKNKENTLKMWILQQFHQILGSITIKSFFGIDHTIMIQNKPLQIYLADLMKVLVKQSINLSSVLFGSWYLNQGFTKSDRQINRKIKLYNNVVLEVLKQKIDQIKKNGIKNKQNNLLSSMIFQAESGDKTDESFSNQQFIQEFNVFFLGGTETGANFLTSVIIELSRNPKSLEVLRKQIEENIKSPQDFNIEVIKRMKYLHAVLYESVRLNPVAQSLLMRRSTIKTYLSKVQIPPGTIVQVELVPNNHNPKYYKDPQKFMPERFLDSKILDEIPQLLTPFSYGLRTCIGKHMAQIQMKIIIIKFLQRYDFKIESEIKREFGFIHSPIYFETILNKRE